MRVFATLVVTTAVAVNIRKLSQMLDKGDCDGMFKSGLVPIGSPVGTTPTHYISSGQVPAAYINAVTSPTRLYTIAKKAWEDDALVFPFTQAQVTNALSKCSYSDGTFTSTIDGVTAARPESPFALMARLGLEPARTAI